MVFAAILVFLVPGAIVNLSFTRNFEAMFMQSFKMNNVSLEFRMARNDKLISECIALGIDDIDMLHKKTGELIGNINEIEDILFVPVAPSDADINSSTSGFQTASFSYNGVNVLFNNSNTLITGMETMLVNYKDLLAEITEGSFDQEVLGALDINQYLPVKKIESEGGSPIAPSALVQALQVLKGSVLDAEAAALRMLRQNNTNPINSES